jgi:hypothetical protein
MAAVGSAGVQESLVVSRDRENCCLATLHRASELVILIHGRGRIRVDHAHKCRTSADLTLDNSLPVELREQSFPANPHLLP